MPPTPDPKEALRSSLINSCEREKIAECSKQLEQIINANFSFVADQLKTAFEVDQIRQMTWNEFYHTIHQVVMHVIKVAIATATGIYIPIGGTFLDVQTVSVNPPSTPGGAATTTPTGSANIAVHTEGDKWERGARGEVVNVGVGQVMQGISSATSGSHHLTRQFSAVTANLAAKDVPKTLAELALYFEYLFSEKKIDNSGDLDPEPKGVLSENGKAIFVPYIIAKGATSGDSLFTDPNFRWFYYSELISKQLKGDVNKTRAEQIVFLKRGFMRYTRRDRIFGHRTAAIHEASNPLASNVLRMYRVSAAEADLVAITNPGDHLTKSWLRTNFFSRTGTLSSGAPTQYQAGIQSTWGTGSNTPWKRFAGLFTLSGGSSDAEWARKKAYVCWFIFHKFLEVRTGTALPILLPPTDELPRQCACAILDTLEMASWIPTFAKANFLDSIDNVKNNNRLFLNVMNLPIVQYFLRYKTNNYPAQIQVAGVAKNLTMSLNWSRLVLEQIRNLLGAAHTFPYDINNADHNAAFKLMYIEPSSLLFGSQSFNTEIILSGNNAYYDKLKQRLDAMTPGINPREAWCIHPNVILAFKSMFPEIENPVVAAARSPASNSIYSPYFTENNIKATFTGVTGGKVLDDYVNKKSDALTAFEMQTSLSDRMNQATQATVGAGAGATTRSVQDISNLLSTTMQDVKDAQDYRVKQEDYLRLLTQHVGRSITVHEEIMYVKNHPYYKILFPPTQ